MDDIATWCHLGFYFADKLRAGVALQTFILEPLPKYKQQGVVLLEKCLAHWKNVVKLTADRYQKMPYVSMTLDQLPHESQWGEPMTSFHWSNFLKDVEADIEFAENIEVVG